MVVGAGGGGRAGQEGSVACKDDKEWFLGAYRLAGETNLNNDKFK